MAYEDDSAPVGFWDWLIVYHWPTIFDNLWFLAFMVSLVGLLGLWVYEKIWDWRNK